MQPFNFCLSNGVHVIIRGVEPADKRHIIDGLDKLSRQSTFYRFNTHLPCLNERQLDYLTRVDQVDHAALGVMCWGGEDHGLPIGIGRYIRQKDDPSIAEIAITVLDAYQRMGTGALLMVGLCQIARTREVEHFFMQVHSSRYGLIRKLADSGAKVERVSDGISELTLSVERVLDIVRSYDKQLSNACEMFGAQWRGNY